MAKIMLVEDDNNLRQIYEDRLIAEGHTVVTAGDGEEALALAIKEKPDLIIADIMMPKVSGFDMLDILRSTPETKDTKIIVMTALGQAEDRQHAESLGADRYLVKSQVTLEDVTQVANEMLNVQQQSENTAVNNMVSAEASQSGSTEAVAATPAQANPAPAIKTEPTIDNSQTPATPPEATPAAGSSMPPIDTNSPATPPADATPKASGVPPVGPPTDTTSPATPPSTTDDSNAPVEPPKPTQPTTKSIPVNMPDDDDEKPDDKPVVQTDNSKQPKTEPETETKTDSPIPKPASSNPPAAPKLDDFIANNPTLSTSATPTETDTSNAPESSQESNPEADSQANSTKDDNADKVADAVDSLLKETEKPSSSNVSEETAKPVADAKPKTESDEPKAAETTGTNTMDDVKPATGVTATHGKKIEPLSDLTTQPPDLNELLAKEASKEAAPPAVSSVISPNGAAAPTVSSQPGSPITPDTTITPQAPQNHSDVAL